MESIYIIPCFSLVIIGTLLSAYLSRCMHNSKARKFQLKDFKTLNSLTKYRFPKYYSILFWNSGGKDPSGWQGMVKTVNISPKSFKKYIKKFSNVNKY